MKIYKVRFSPDENSDLPKSLMSAHTLFMGIEFTGFRVSPAGLTAIRRNHKLMYLAGNPLDPLDQDGNGWRHRGIPYWLIRVDKLVPPDEAHFDRKTI